MEHYNAGKGNEDITLEVIVGTEGVAYSEFIIIKDLKTSGIMGQSTEKSGSIVQATIGTADNLKDGIIFIKNIISFSHLNKDQRESAFDKMVISYVLDGGVDGKKEYSFSKEADLIVAPDKKTLTIATLIGLK